MKKLLILFSTMMFLLLTPCLHAIQASTEDNVFFRVHKIETSVYDQDEETYVKVESQFSNMLGTMNTETSVLKLYFDDPMSLYLVLPGEKNKDFYVEGDVYNSYYYKAVNDDGEEREVIIQESPTSTFISVAILNRKDFLIVMFAYKI